MAGLILTYAWIVLLLAASAAPEGAGAHAASTPASVQGAEAPESVAEPEVARAIDRGPTGLTSSTSSTSPTSAAPAADQGAGAILRATAAAYESLASLKADFSQTLRNTLLGRTVQSAGTLYERAPDKFLMAFSDPAGDRVVSDGRYFWMYYPSVDDKQVLRAPRRGQGLDLQAQFIGDPTTRFEYTYEGSEEVRGRNAHVFTLVPKEPAGYLQMKVWIDAEDHLVRRFELAEENGIIRHLELSNLEVNPTLADSLFEFTPPAGAIVVDRG